MSNFTTLQMLEESQQAIEALGLPKASIGLILGTGMAGFLDQVEILQSISYSDIPHWMPPTVMSHEGFLHCVKAAGQYLWVCQGRLHRYEGYSDDEITYPVRVLHQLGVQQLFITNAAGAINLNYAKGELLLIDDHINLQGGSPLASAAAAALGPRFVDMRAPYSPKLQHQWLELAQNQQTTLHQGVYAAVVGPQLETRAEYRYLKTIGADAVGMSTVPEVIVANQLAVEVLAISVLTDLCDPDDLQPIDIPEIMAMAARGEQQFSKLMLSYLQSL